VFAQSVNQALDVSSSSVPKKGGINQKGVNQKYSHENNWIGVNVTECSQPKGARGKMKGSELTSGVHWQGALKQYGCVGGA
jgi:hypothetical protein